MFTDNNFVNLQNDIQDCSVNSFHILNHASHACSWQNA